jgi:hypothetical protein
MSSRYMIKRIPQLLKNGMSLLNRDESANRQTWMTSFRVFTASIFLYVGILKILLTASDWWLADDLHISLGLHIAKTNKNLQYFLPALLQWQVILPRAYCAWDKLICHGDGLVLELPQNPILLHCKTHGSCVIRFKLLTKCLTLPPIGALSRSDMLLAPVSLLVMNFLYLSQTVPSLL